MKQPHAVVNRDSAPYSEKWREQHISIQSGHAILMSRRDAVDFMGTYGGNDPKEPTKPKVKNLVMIPADQWKGQVDQTIGSTTPEPVMPYVCNYDGQTFPTKEQLDAHLATHSDKAIKEELASPDGPVTCPFCGQTGLKGAGGLKVHMTQHCKAIKGDINDNTSTGVHADTVAG